jgi:hypothetical protein
MNSRNDKNMMAVVFITNSIKKISPFFKEGDFYG